MGMKYCQCCAMSMGEGKELYGTNSDGRSKVLCQDQRQKMI